MLNALRKRLERDEEGFTLIELMVVVLIIAILLAIAIPTFLGARERAQNRAAQSDIRNAYAASKVLYTDDQTFTSSTTALGVVEPALSFVASAPEAKDNEVLVETAANAATPAVANQVVCISTQAATGNWYAVREIATGPGAGVKYYKSEGSGAQPPAACATTVATYNLPKW